MVAKKREKGKIDVWWFIQKLEVTKEALKTWTRFQAPIKRIKLVTIAVNANEGKRRYRDEGGH